MSEFFAIPLIILLAVISPGPDFAIVVKNSLLYGRKSGIYTALGVVASLLVHASYCILGLAFIISQSLLLFNIIKYMGAAYLIYIGIKSLLTNYHASHLMERASVKKVSNLQIFTQGLLCNLLNPKAILFIIAFFTLIVKPTTSLLTQIGYGVELVTIPLIWFSCLSLVITHKQVRNSLANIQHYIVKVTGIVLIGFGARIALLG